MTIEVSCECEMTYRLPDRFAGKRCRCRECGDSIRVPAAREDRAPASKAAVKDPSRTKKQRLKTIPSESLQQLAPLNLSESRHMDPPAARARIKKIKAEAKAPVSAKKRAAAGGPASESEIEVSRPEKPGKKTKKKKKDAKVKKKLGKKAKKNRDRDRRLDDEDGGDEDEAPRKKKKKAKKADKAQKKLLAKKKKRETDEDASAEEEDEDAPRRDPRAEKRRQNLIILGVAFGALLAVGGLVLGINMSRARAEEAVAKKAKDVKDAMAAAQATAKAGDIDKADKQYGDAIALADDKTVALPDDDAELDKAIKVFKLQRGFFDKIKTARAALASDPAKAGDLFFDLTGAEDEVIRTAALDGLCQAKDSRAAEVCSKFVNDSHPSVKAAARKGMVDAGGAVAQPLLAGIINSEPSTDLGKLAMQRALEAGNNPNIDAILAVCDKSQDPQQLVSALKILARMLDPRGKEAAERLSKHADAGVAAEAQKTLAEIKGYEKG